MAKAKKSTKTKKKTVTKKEKVIEGNGEKGLKPEWILFIDEYMRNGFNATRAYEKVYKCSYKVANARGSVLLVNDSISKEIGYRLNSQRCTDDFIISGLMSIAIDYRGAKTINAAVKSYEILGKVRGLLIDTKKIAFTGDNPALFPALVKADNAKKFAEEEAKGERIAE